MHIEFYKNPTWLHYVNPTLKFILFVFLFIFFLFIHHLHFLIYFTVLLTLIYYIQLGYPIKLLFLLSLPMVIIFFTSFVSMALFGKGETTLFQFAFVHITEEGLYRGIHLGFRSVIFGLLGMIFALTTKPVYFFYSLMQQLSLPPKIAYSFMAAIRLLPNIIQEFLSLRKALKVRGVIFKRSIPGFYQQIKHYAIPILALSIRRAYHISVAMEAKHFTNNRNRTYYYILKYSKRDVYFVFLTIVLLFAAYILQRFYPFLPIDRIVA
ncbi:energy-coupling factor transporter transmembrane component T family protein [Gracilibacillus marinus]|uniref:Energy-coupling factor transporter transmembrane component T family protein n=1 Tax=Gracilibacillus marinus TaxID=630535 RepID=A0ABV8VVI5_9BACI